MKIFSHIIIFIISYFWIAFWFMASSSLWHGMMVSNGFVKGIYFSSLVVSIWLVICGLFTLIKSFIFKD